MKKEKKKKKCEQSKLVSPRYFGDFYYQGTNNVPCIREQETIRSWGTFCGSNCVKVINLSILIWAQKDRS